MPNKDFTLDSGLTVTIYKRKSSRNLRLTISPTGQVRVSIPAWAPYREGLNFVKSRDAWIRNRRTEVQPLRPGQAVGKGHHLRFAPKPAAKRVTTRILGNQVVIYHPDSYHYADPEIQLAAQKVCHKALRQQAERLLPARLEDLSRLHDLPFEGISIRLLRSRWGSCNHRRHIVLNLFLMQLPWELIDYVILHELTHTKVLHHGPDFWRAMNQVSPQSTILRKKLRQYQPVLNTAV